jgi:hypothetical protein
MQAHEAAIDTQALDVVELRRYTLRPGRREDLIALFEREFIETQEACGMLPIGQYRNLDDPDEFVWFRGFMNMASRRRALEAFYLHSDAWRAHRDAANDTMIDSDNVLLLRPVSAAHGFDLLGLQRAPMGAAPQDRSLVGVAVFMLTAPLDGETLHRFETETFSKLERHAYRVALLETEPAKNDFRLPVREGEWAFVVTGVCGNEAGLVSFLQALELDRVPPALRANVIRAEYLRLEPAARALYR